MVYRTNYSRGYIVNYEELCFDSWLLIPAETLWDDTLRGFLYLLGMMYIFIGIAIVADIFVSSIEVITSKKKTVTRYDTEKGESYETEVFVWNETVANLTLMALGSSAPEILLAVIETTTNLDNLDCDSSSAECDSLGTFTIIGSAAFNLLLISAICIVSVPSHTVKKITEFGVFLLTAVWSMFAYVWMLVVLMWISPGEVEIWEAFVTLAFFPALVLTAWAQDKGWWIKKRRVSSSLMETSTHTIRVLGVSENRHSVVMHRSMELSALEAAHRKSTTGPEISQVDLKDIQKRKMKIREVVSYWKGCQPEDTNAAQHVAEVLQDMKDEPNQNHKIIVRARFRRAALRCITGGRTRKLSRGPVSLGSEITSINTVSSISTRPRLLSVVNTLKQSRVSVDHSEVTKAGSFSFASPTYSVLKSAGHIKINVNLNWRKRKSKRWQSVARRITSPYNPATAIKDNTIHTVGFSNGKLASSQLTPEVLENVTDHDLENNNSESEEDELNNDTSLPSCLCIEYETRDGTAVKGKDYQAKSGLLTFKQHEGRKDIDVPIIMKEFSNNHDFYIILKNPSNDADILDPLITRVTIIDDDEPGEFSFEQASYHANFVTESVTLTVVREKGCDGAVSVQYQTVNGTAHGGSTAELEAKKCDFENLQSKTLTFGHGETRRQIDILVNTQAQNKNFIMLLKEPSAGARLGERSAAVLHISSDIDDIVDRVTNIMTSHDDVSITSLWSTQFEEAMNVPSGEDEEGNAYKPGPASYVLHFLTFFWKFLFAFIPPRTVWGGWPTFVFSLAFIALLTAVVEQLGKLLGCVLNLRNSVTGISIIAIGTSLPDTFASRTAALHDTYADAAIGNITGSNSVNVFLGLGVPWVISALYMYSKGKTFHVSTDNLVFSVVVFVSAGTVGLILMVIRRKFLGGELGGPKLSKFLSASLFIGLWLLYITLASLMAYDQFDFSL